MCTNLKYLFQCNMTRAIVLTVEKLCIKKIYFTWYKKMVCNEIFNLSHEKAKKLTQKWKICHVNMANKSKWCTGYLGTNTRREHWSEKQISHHSHNVVPNAMVSNFFLEKGVDIFLWLEVCTAQYINETVSHMLLFSFDTFDFFQDDLCRIRVSVACCYVYKWSKN